MREDHGSTGVLVPVRHVVHPGADAHPAVGYGVVFRHFLLRDLERLELGPIRLNLIHRSLDGLVGCDCFSALSHDWFYGQTNNKVENFGVGGWLGFDFQKSGAGPARK